MSTTIAPDDFQFIRELIYREAALVLEPGKEYLATSRLEPLARQHNLDGIPGLVKKLRATPTGPLRMEVVDAMTTNETLWFRDQHPFDSLRDSILPELITARSAARSLSIWCAAASTGQEPYSLAMLIKEHFPQIASWNVRITATDISPSALEKAKTGIYTQMEMGRGLPAKMMVAHFARAGMNFQISPHIRSMVDFSLFNLAGNWPPMGPFDLVFIRNVLIYFNHQTKTEIVRKAHRTLRADGYLILGSTESLLNTPNEFDRVPHGKTTCYKPASP